MNLNLLFLYLCCLQWFCIGGMFFSDDFGISTILFLLSIGFGILAMGFEIIRIKSIEVKDEKKYY